MTKSGVKFWIIHRGGSVGDNSLASRRVLERRGRWLVSLDLSHDGCPTTEDEDDILHADYFLNSPRGLLESRGHER